MEQSCCAVTEAKTNKPIESTFQVSCFYKQQHQSEEQQICRKRDKTRQEKRRIKGNQCLLVLVTRLTIKILINGDIIKHGKKQCSKGVSIKHYSPLMALML